MKPAGITAEAVVVSAAEPSQVDTTRTIVGGTVATREIESLPVNSRSPLDLIFTLGGVAEEPLSTRDLAQDRTSSRSTPEEAGIFHFPAAPLIQTTSQLTVSTTTTTGPRASALRHPSKRLTKVQSFAISLPPSMVARPAGA